MNDAEVGSSRHVMNRITDWRNPFLGARVLCLRFMTFLFGRLVGLRSQQTDDSTDGIGQQEHAHDKADESERAQFGANSKQSSQDGYN